MSSRKNVKTYPARITFCCTWTVFKLILALAKQQAAKCLRQNNQPTNNCYSEKIKSLFFGITDGNNKVAARPRGRPEWTTGLSHSQKKTVTCQLWSDLLRSRQFCLQKNDTVVCGCNQTCFLDWKWYRNAVVSGALARVHQNMLAELTLLPGISSALWWGGEEKDNE